MSATKSTVTGTTEPIEPGQVGVADAVLRDGDVLEIVYYVNGVEMRRQVAQGTAMADVTEDDGTVSRFGVGVQCIIRCSNSIGLE